MAPTKAIDSMFGTAVDGGLLATQSDVDNPRAFEEKGEPFHQLIAMVPDGIFVFVEERFAFVSPSGLELIGAQSADQVLGRLLWDLLQPDYHAAGRYRHDLCRRDKCSCPLAEFKLIRLDGRIQDIESACTHVTFEGKPAVLTVWRDISKRKRTETTLQCYQLMTEHSRDIILFMRSEDGQILEANQAALNAYGYSREEMTKLTIRDLRSPETAGEIQQQMSVADSQGILFETLHRSKDGRTFPVEVSSQGTSIQGMRVLISVIRDISERRETMKKLLDLDSAVRVILEKGEESKKEWEKNVLLQIKTMVLPYLEKLCSGRLSELQKSCLAAIEENLKEIVAPFNGFSSLNYYSFTGKELQIADLIKRGKATKEIAELMQISKRAVEFHRNNLRKKLGISNQKANLKNHLFNLK